MYSLRSPLLPLACDPSGGERYKCGLLYMWLEFFVSLCVVMLCVSPGAIDNLCTILNPNWSRSHGWSVHMSMYVCMLHMVWLRCVGHLDCQCQSTCIILNPNSSMWSLNPNGDGRHTYGACQKVHCTYETEILNNTVLNPNWPMVLPSTVYCISLNPNWTWVRVDGPVGRSSGTAVK